MDRDARIEAALAYHERTKHGYPGRHARSLGYLDWASQPDPFRRYEGAPLVLLDEVPPGAGRELEWASAHAGEAAPAALDARAIAQLFYDSLAISAWKQAGRSRWALRCNPSSGNLHPTEAYLLAGPVDGLSTAPALFHYAPAVHGLERRRALAPDAWRALERGLPSGAIVIGLASIVWREAWKYGERAFRYCMHDVGHAIGAITVAARPLGWSVRPLAGLGDREVARLLALDDQEGPEAERPDLLLVIETRPAGTETRSVSAGAIPISLSSAELGALAGDAAGTPNRLSDGHHDWPVLAEIEVATRGDGVLPAAVVLAPASRDGGTPPASTRAIVRARRSAVDMDATTSISREALHRMMRTLVPRAPLWSAFPWRARVHPVLFLHRVEGVDPGLAILVRDPAEEPALRAAISLADEWVRLPGCPDDLPLFGIAHGDARDVARAVCCHQDIASDGALAVAMLARFEPTIRDEGAAAYRRLHWEAGMLGQLLYLEAEAHGVSATGIGCFFDDAIHELLGLTDRTFQSLYSFTLGGAVHDARIQTLPSYPSRG